MMVMLMIVVVMMSFAMAVAMVRFLILMAVAVMRFLILVAVAMMRFLILMAVAMMLFLVLVAMAVMRFFMMMFLCLRRFRRDRCRPIEIGHIMVMIFMGFIQDDIEITARDAGFLDTGNLHHEAVCRDGIQRAFQRFRICAEVDHRCDEHISADAGGSFKVQCFSHFGFSL